MTFRQKHVELKNRLQFQIVSSLEKCRMNKHNVPFMNVVEGRGRGNLGWASLGINRFDVFPFFLCYFIFEFDFPYNPSNRTIFFRQNRLRSVRQQSPAKSSSRSLHRPRRGGQEDPLQERFVAKVRFHSTYIG